MKCAGHVLDYTQTIRFISQVPVYCTFLMFHPVAKISHAQHGLSQLASVMCWFYLERGVFLLALCWHKRFAILVQQHVFIPFCSYHKMESSLILPSQLYWGSQWSNSITEWRRTLWSRVWHVWPAIEYTQPQAFWHLTWRSTCKPIWATWKVEEVLILHRKRLIPSFTRYY